MILLHRRRRRNLKSNARKTRMPTHSKTVTRLRSRRMLMSFFVYNDGSFTKGKKAAAVTDVDVTNVLTPAWGMAGKTITITHTDDSTPITVRSKMGLLELQLEYYVNKFQEPDATNPTPPTFRKPKDGTLKITYDYMKKLKIDDATKARTEYFIHTTLKFEDQDVIEINKEPRITSGTRFELPRFKRASTDKYTYNCGDESTLPWFTKAGKEDHIPVPSMMKTLVKAWGKGKGTTTDPDPMKKMKIGRSIRILGKDGAIVRFVPIKEALENAAVDHKIAKVTSVSGSRARDAYVNMMDEYGYSLGEQTASAVASEARMELVDQYYYDAEVEAAREELALKRLERERARASLPRRKRSKYRNR
eukprot:601926_1